MSKKMKRVVMESSPYAVYDDAKSRFKHQSLLQDYHELQKETEAMRRKLQSVKQDKLTLLAEVRFLRRRYKYLMKNNAPPKTPPKPEFKQKQNSLTQLKNIPREKNHSGKQAAAMRNPTLGFGGNMKERIYKGKVAGMANPDPSYELNQKSRGYSPKEAAALRNPVPVGRNPVPFLDLNKISREEEEEEEEEVVQVNVESVGVEQQQQQQQMKSVIRGGGNGNDDQLSDMKLSACRNIGNGPNRAGKRKISWQDQLALRV